MTQRFFPAVLERDEGGAYGVWFPDFPGAVAAGRTQEDALARATTAVAEAVEDLALAGQSLPEPTAIEAIELPKGCKPAAFVAIGVEPPDQSERVNVYLPKSLLKRVDARAAELGMSRSSFFGFAVSHAVTVGENIVDLLRRNQDLEGAQAETLLYWRRGKTRR